MPIASGRSLQLQVPVCCLCPSSSSTGTKKEPLENPGKSSTKNFHSWLPACIPMVLPLFLKYQLWLKPGIYKTRRKAQLHGVHSCTENSAVNILEEMSNYFSWQAWCWLHYPCSWFSCAASDPRCISPRKAGNKFENMFLRFSSLKGNMFFIWEKV